MAFTVPQWDLGQGLLARLDPRQRIEKQDQLEYKLKVATPGQLQSFEHVLKVVITLNKHRRLFILQKQFILMCRQARLEQLLTLLQQLDTTIHLLLTQLVL